MKSINKIIGILCFLLSCISCEKDFSVDLANRGFVRLNQQNVSLTVGEKYTIKANMDSLGTQSKALTWTILDSKVASIEAKDDHTAVITAEGAGTTVVKVESTDGSVKYFSDLSVAKDRVIKILAIGNSFSEDAIENYLHDLATAAGYKIMIANMYIGGSSLEDHWTNASEQQAAYQMRVISPDGSRNVFNERTIEEAINAENWDYISFQQVSQLSGIFDSYEAYLPKLLQYTKPLTTNPELQFILHQTWAYAEDSNHFGFANYDNDQMKMYNAIVNAVWDAKEQFGIDMVIPSGTAIQNARTSYIGDKFTRDGYHLNLGVGRFTAASAWFEALFGDVMNNTFIPENFSAYDVALVKTAAAQAVEKPKEITVLTEFQSPPPNDFELLSPIYIDFGGVVAGGFFNHFNHPNDLKIGGLKDVDGTNSDFSIEVSEPFSGTLDRNLQNALGWSQNVSRDMFFTDGIHIGQSGFRLTNLNKNKKYTLAFYGAINDDQTETAFTVIGKNQGSGVLDNDNNLAKLVIIKDIEPAADASINIQLRPGPNNNHWAKFFGISAMMIVPEGMDVPVALNNFNLQQPIYIDFGPILAGGSFNHFDAPNDLPRFDLKDVLGTNTGFAINIVDRFVNQNESGALTNTLDLPVAVTQDAFYGDKNNATAGFTVYNLNKEQQYQFIFYGARRGVNDNRETKYIVKGNTDGSAVLDASNNESVMAVVTDIQPRDDGTVDIVLSAGSNNTNGDNFYYINAMIITPVGHTLP